VVARTGVNPAVLFLGLVLATMPLGAFAAGIPPSITQQPVSLTVTQGTTATFNVVANGDPPLRYQWYFFGTALS